MARKVMKQEVGTIYQKPSGIYYYRYQINGERKAISLKTKNQCAKLRENGLKSL